MMTSTQRQSLQERRNAAFWLAMFLLAAATAAVFIFGTQFVPVTTPDPMLAPWNDDSEPEENPCPTPVHPYFDQQP